MKTRFEVKIHPARGAIALTAAAVLALLAVPIATTGCHYESGQATGESAAAEHGASGHAESFEAAKAMAVKRQVPILVDFYSPT